MHSVCRCSLPVWRRSCLKKGTPVTYFGPALDPPLGGSGRKTTTLVRDHEYFIPTKFHQNPSSGSGEEVENVKSLRTPDRRTDGRTDDGRCAMTIAHSSLRLRWAKKGGPCRCRTVTLKNPAKCLWRWEPDRRYDFFNPPAHLCRHIYDWNIIACDIKHQ